MADANGPYVVGRADEITVLTELIATVPGRGRVVLIHGEPGIGKTTLAAAARDLAAEKDFRVLTASGVQSEVRLAFAGLHQLLHPLRHLVGGLPPAQNTAISSALGYTDAEPPNEYVVGLATLNLLTDRASDRPLLVIAEDVQWMDEPTRQVLRFVARRISSDPILILVTDRDPGGDAFDANESDFVRLHLRGLNDEDSRALLATSAAAGTTAARRTVLEQAAGNPLALIELGSVFGDPTFPISPTAPIPLTKRLERVFAAKADVVDPEARALLLALALNDGSLLSENLRVARIASGLAVSSESLQAAVDAGLLLEENQGTVSFRHGLVRSAVRQAAPLEQIRATHAALADVLSNDPDRRIWHLAAARSEADETVAHELEVLGRRLSRFNDITLAVRAFEMSAQLSADLKQRTGRQLLAAESLLSKGGYEEAGKILASVDQNIRLDPSPDQTHQAHLAWLGAVLRGGAGGFDIQSLVSMVDQMRRSGAQDEALRALTTVAMQSWFTNPQPETSRLLLEAVDRFDVPIETPELIAIYTYSGVPERTQGLTPAVMRGARARHPDAESAQQIGFALTVMLDSPQAATYLAEAVAGYRAQGKLEELSRSLTSLAGCQEYLGDWAGAISSAEESASYGFETGAPMTQYHAQLILARMFALQGRFDEAESLINAIRPIGTAYGIRPLNAGVQLAAGTVELGAGRNESALHEFQKIYDPGTSTNHPLFMKLALLDYCDAAARSGHRSTPADIVQGYEEEHDITASPFLLRKLLFCRAVLADDDVAETQFTAALESEYGNAPFEHARVLFSYGQWLRRQRRTHESRTPLREAWTSFKALGAATWAEAARSELRAAGEATANWAKVEQSALSPRELDISRLAAEGLSNRQIAERLYLSHRTVGAHLYAIYPKLGVASRGELKQALNVYAPFREDTEPPQL